ncbi:hypothetical protein OJF2_67850 [Aquisphaera giovannonii]|uniref:Nickel uptake substrate-specific transmembrane region n=1 Tax=Aquisphaera giovannonii TaxID=406548 RepID=A0A5B9WCD4_9BACT|nr:hypothetical protein [Aquisphaera giovannonii]QEH38187.1 hypothetical protein OJF2_67850 [Aquisphaera giovannonii]
MRLLRYGSFLSVTVLATGLAAAQEYKVEELKEAAPSGFAPEVSSALNPHGYRITDAEGKPLASLWLRKEVPAASKPGAPQGVIQFPFLASSELLGVIRFDGEGHDYRDQAIPKGLYTLRYGLQPVNGDHLGVSPFRDYSMLLPAAKDKTVGVLPKKQLETQSAEAAGTSHPGILFMLSASADAKAPSMIHDGEKNTWRVVVPLSLAVKGEAKPSPYPVSIILVGASEGA